MSSICRQCSAPLDLLKPGRIPTYCSTRCRVAAHRASIPGELRGSDRWVRWTPAERQGRITKVPLTVDGKPASTTDTATWASFAKVRTHRRKGFVLGGGIGCIDLDHCLIDGVPTESARRYLASVPETYTEVSPSGDGLHLWFRMPEAPGTKRTVDGLSVETYSVSRYITVTGVRFGRCSTLSDY